MKKMLLVLCAVAMMLIPMSSMAAVTGQAGVDIGVTTSSTSIDLRLGSLSWGDPDGFDGYANPGYIILVPPAQASSIGILELGIGVNVGTANKGTATETTAVQLGVTLDSIALDKFAAYIYLESSWTPGSLPADTTKALGMAGLSGLNVTLAQPAVLTISAH